MSGTTAIHLRDIGDPADIRAGTADQHIAYTMAYDADAAMSATYRAPATPLPMLVVIDKAGIVHAVEVGIPHSELDELLTKLLR